VLTGVPCVCFRLDEHKDAEKDAYAEKLKELEGVSNPIVSRLYSGKGGAGAGGDESGGDSDDAPADHDEL
jgi:hypothetical protein